MANMWVLLMVVTVCCGCRAAEISKAADKEVLSDLDAELQLNTMKDEDEPSSEDAVKIMYQNGYDRPLKVICSDGRQGINRIRSGYSHGHGDRRFQFYCSAYSSSSCAVCKTTPNYINKRHQLINFNCPANQVLSGVESIHYNHGEDRTWKFRCCESLGYVTANCELTPFINNFKQSFDYTIPGGKIIVGMHSYWSGNDRRWKLMVCNYVKKE